MIDAIVSYWLDQMVMCGFTSARWWAAIAQGRPVELGE